MKMTTKIKETASFASQFLTGDLHDDNVMLTKDKLYIVDMGT